MSVSFIICLISFLFFSFLFFSFLFFCKNFYVIYCISKSFSLDFDAFFPFLRMFNVTYDMSAIFIFILPINNYFNSTLDTSLQLISPFLYCFLLSSCLMLFMYHSMSIHYLSSHLILLLLKLIIAYFILLFFIFFY